MSRYNSRSNLLITRDLVMDGETHGSVKNYCNPGDTLDGDGGVDIAATARIRNG